MSRRVPAVRTLLAIVSALVMVVRARCPGGRRSDDTGEGCRLGEALAAGPVTDENFYFVMADRFENGNTANDTGGLGERPVGLRVRPDEQGLLQRW